MKKPVRQRYNPQHYRPPATTFRRKLLVIAVGLLLVLAGMGFSGLLAWQQLGQWVFFQVTSIRIDGAERLGKEQVLALSGVDIHSNLLALNPSRVKGRIEEHEWIERAEVKRQWPNRLQIVIRERRPVALLALADGLYYLDRNGVAFARALPPEDLDFPVITGLANGEWPVALKDEVLAEALAFIKSAGRGRSILPAQGISEIHLRPAEGNVLFLINRPFPIYLGRGEMTVKYQRLTRVLYWLYKGKNFTDTAYIRMDYLPDRVLVGKINAG